MNTLSESQQLATAIFIAAAAHEKQKDRGGKPYILHPLYLMNQLLYDTQLATIAVLHDVIEDSDEWTFRDLVKRGFSDRVINALDMLTHKEIDSYDEYIDRICTNIDAITVKRKDIDHNSRTTRLKGVTVKDFNRLDKYHNAFVKLGKARDKIRSL